MTRTEAVKKIGEELIAALDETPNLMSIAYSEHYIVTWNPDTKAYEFTIVRGLNG